MKPGERIYGLLLRVLLPPAFRRESAAELMEVFHDARAAAARSGARGRIRFWRRLTMDLAATSATEWFRTGRTLGRGTMRKMRNPLEEVALAMRTLSRSPGHALLAMLTLALGLGAVVTVFSAVHRVLLHPLPFREPERIVQMYEEGERTRYWPSYPNLADWRESTRTLAALVPFSYPSVVPVRLAGEPRRLAVAGAGRGLLSMLGVAPAVGRPIADAENRPGGAPTAVVSHALWSGPLGGAALDDLSLAIGDEVFDVVGVLPDGFHLIDDVDVWIPLEREPEELGDRGSHGYHVLARIAEGQTLGEVRDELAGITAALREIHGDAVLPRVTVYPFQEALTAGVRRPLLLLLAAAALVFAVACLNLASTVLARGISRSRELAVRLALGAGRSDLIRHLSAETAVIALPGALLGIVMAMVGLGHLRRTGAGIVPRIQELHVDATVVAVSLGLALLAALLAGAGPALVLARRDIGDRLRGLGGTAERREHRRLWDGFLVGQTALTVLLLASTGLLIRSMRAVLDVDLGYDARGVLVADVSLPESRYPSGSDVTGYHERALARLAREPAFQDAGIANVLPDETQTLVTRGASGGATDQTDETVWTSYRLVDQGFFRALRIPVEGALPPPPSSDEAPVAGLIARSLARRFWDGADPTGAELRFGGWSVRVEGTVGDVREWWQQMGLIGAVYVDYRCDPERARSMHIVARPVAGSDPADAAARLRASLLEVDPEVPATIARFDERVYDSVSRRRLSLDIVTAFALLAVLLAGVAVYGAVSYAVARRTREVGIRLTLGAGVRRVRIRIVKGGLGPVAVGVVLGVVGAAMAAPVLRAHLFGVRPTDPWTLALAPLVLLAIAAPAAYLPARRTSRVDPIQALRSER